MVGSSFSTSPSRTSTVPTEVASVHAVKSMVIPPFTEQTVQGRIRRRGGHSLPDICLVEPNQQASHCGTRAADWLIANALVTPTCGAENDTTTVAVSILNPTDLSASSAKLVSARPRRWQQFSTGRPPRFPPIATPVRHLLNACCRIYTLTPTTCLRLRSERSTQWLLQTGKCFPILRVTWAALTSRRCRLTRATIPPSASCRNECLLRSENNSPST